MFDEDITVWIVEDDSLFRETVQTLLNSTPGIECKEAFGSCEEMLSALSERFAPEVMLMDIGLTGIDGIEGSRRIKSISPTTDIIILTVHEDSDKIVEAICAGASGYLLKPSSGEQIIGAIQAARRGGASINPQIAGKILDMFALMAVPRGDYGLTDREREILQYLVEGQTKKHISESLYLSYHTVDMHIRNIYAKLHVHSRPRAVAKALRERLI